MFNLRQLVKQFFLRKKAKISNSEKSFASIISSFKITYWNFKSILSINNKILEIISEMEMALRGDYKFGMGFIRARCTSISVNIYKLIEKINDITGNRYKKLYYSFADIQHRINQILEERGKAIEVDLVLSIEEITKESIKYSGSKMARLGEIMNHTELNVPQGFVITASAYNLFFETNALQKAINQQLQSIDIEDIIILEKTSSKIQKLIIQATIPPELEKAILDSYNYLEAMTEKGVKVSMRSSALGEDSQGTSFAGQYHTELNVGYNDLISSYKKILASKYSLRAITYRFNNGLPDEDIVMCVGCMAMVESVSSGVMYTQDPSDINNNNIFINAVFGLGKKVVEGSISPDLFVISKEKNVQILKKEIHIKDQEILSFSNKKLKNVELPKTDSNMPAITDSQAISLVNQAIILENHFKAPQDIEWAIEQDGSIRILQSRPMKQVIKENNKPEDILAIRVDNPIILNGGVAASQGVAFGPAFIVRSAEEMYKFPKGAVLVVKDSLPQWATVINRAVAVVTDRGGIAGHLATVAREFGIPALFDTVVSTYKIKSGDLITVDSYTRKVYKGKVEVLLSQSIQGTSNTVKESPVYIILKRILKYITPLNLIDPQDDNFAPESCYTYHDITRFCHEKAVKVMFNFGRSNRKMKAGKRLIINDTPSQWFIINLGDGLKGLIGKDTLRLENIVSIPMLAFWEGMTAVEWDGPPPIDTKGLMSIIFESTMNHELNILTQSRRKQNDCAIISKHFCNLSCRFGYHYSVVQAFISNRARANYIKFYFKGGAADLKRKFYRIKLIEEILAQYDFQITIYEDYMNANIERYEQLFLIKRLKILGYLTAHIRQLDMIMGNPARVAYYKKKFLKDIRLIQDSS